MKILDKAAEIGRLLAASREYQALCRAREELQGDATARELVQNFQMLQQSYERMHMTGYQLTEEHVDRLKKAEQDMLANAVVRRYFAARQDFNHLFNQVLTRLRQHVDLS